MTRIAVRAFCFGMLLSGTIASALIIIHERQRPETRAAETLDFLIDAWTADRIQLDTVVVLVQQIDFRFTVWI